MKTGIHINLALLTGLLLSGCIAERPEVCYSGLSLHYRYELNPTRANLFDAEVDALTILAFDERGLFHESFEVKDQAQLGNDNLIHLPLPDGRWDILTWGGDMASFGIGSMIRNPDNTISDVPLEKGVTTIDNVRLWIDEHTALENGGKLVTKPLSQLYYGMVEGAEARTSTSPPEPRQVYMMRNTNTLRVILSGIPPRAAFPGPGSRADDDPVEITATANMTNERYCADNSICDQVRFTRHVQSRTLEDWGGSGPMQIDMTVMRLFTYDDDSMLSLSGGIPEALGIDPARFTIPIVPTILASDSYDTQEHLDRENLFVFEFRLDGSGGIEIYINNWKVTDTIVDI